MNATVTLVCMEENALTWSTDTCATVSQEPQVQTASTIMTTVPAILVTLGSVKMESTNTNVSASRGSQVLSVT